MNDHKVSQNAFQRILALYNQEITAAARMLAGDGYSDFFVEGSGPPWHEAFGDAASAEHIQETFSAARMTYVSAVELMPIGDGYSDFFVEGSGPPWHEAFGDAASAEKLFENPLNLHLRVQALKNLNVIQAYSLLRQRTEEVARNKSKTQE